VKRISAFILSMLMLSAPALAQTASEQPKIYKDKPIGEGDPNATSCYPSPSSISRVKKMDCRPNSEWARISGADKGIDRIDTGKEAGGPVNIMH